MNDRQLALHQFLLNHPFEYTKRVDILCALKYWYYGVKTTDLDIMMDNIYFSNQGSLLTKDIKYLKQVSGKIIISSKEGIKYATKEEFVEYYRKQNIAINSRRKLLSTQAKKYGLNEQITLEGDVVVSVIKGAK